MSGDEIMHAVGTRRWAERGAQRLRARRGRERARARLARELGRDPEKPLFLYLHYLDAHSPLAAEPPEGGTRSTRTSSASAACTASAAALLWTASSDNARVRELRRPRSPGPKAIVFTSDHGEEFGSTTSGATGTRSTRSSSGCRSS